MDTVINIENAIEKYKNNFQFYEILLSIFTKIGITIFTVQIPQAKVYRARINKNIFNFDKVSEISYALPQHVTSYGRVNRPFQNLFYASDSHSTCIAELKPYIKNEKYIKGDIIPITIGLWELNSPVTVLVIPDKSNPILTDFLEVINHFDISIENSKLLEMINILFKKNQKDENEIYKITTAFANAFFINCYFQNKIIDGILYTSVQDSNGFNIALLPNVIDNIKLELKEIIKGYYQIESNFDLNPIKVIEPIEFSFEKNIILWE